MPIARSAVRLGAGMMDAKALIAASAEGTSIDPAAFELVPARKYVHVAAILSNGQRTARFSLNRETGMWHQQKGWKIAGPPLSSAQAAYAQSVYDALQRS